MFHVERALQVTRKAICPSFFHIFLLQVGVLGHVGLELKGLLQIWRNSDVGGFVNQIDYLFLEHEVPLSGYLILLLREELNHICKFVQFEEEQAWAVLGRDNDAFAHQPLSYYRKKEKWLKGKTKMWYVFPNDMGLDNSFKLALSNLDLNDWALEPVTSDDGDPLEGSSSTSTDA